MAPARVEIVVVMLRTKAAGNLVLLEERNAPAAVRLFVSQSGADPRENTCTHRQDENSFMRCLACFRGAEGGGGAPSSLQLPLLHPPAVLGFSSLASPFFARPHYLRAWKRL